MIKKSLMAFCMAFIILTFLVTAQNKIEISTIKEDFEAGENIAFKVSLYDAQNNPINADVNVIIEDAEKTKKIEQVVQSNKIVDINLGEGARYGYWTITSKYKDMEGTTLFNIKIKELIKFEIINNRLIVTNIGNTRYKKTIQIVIGNSLGTKELDLDVGEEASFRLIAPDGIYNVRVTDGEITITKEDVVLTGKAIGILDEKLIAGGNPLTGGVKPEETGEDERFYTTLRNKKFVYIFLLVIIGAAILLAIERNYRKKI